MQVLTKAPEAGGGPVSVFVHPGKISLKGPAAFSHHIPTVIFKQPTSCSWCTAHDWPRL